ncbi:MAG: recombinase family protein [Defluviitaleaceae bacterium]|nr:recombinase family protein [Defluviitaleaceae bacterium]
MKGQKQKVTILYERLSRDDELQGTSNSILNQRQLLEEYAEKNNLIPYIHIQDDGYSGTNWNRPGWQELITKVENDEVHCICIKDNTRLGRDYLRAGLYREMFRERGVRLVAVNDGFDSESGEDDFTPFREIMAELYARDTSRKVKSVLTAKGKSSRPTCNIPPYGFTKDPNDKYKWIIDETAANIVRRIFQMAMDGIGPCQIARILKEEKVERPSYYFGKHGQGTRRNDFDPDYPYTWNGTTVGKMLSQLEYCGHLANLKTTTSDFKSKKIHVKPKEEWYVFENHHEAIISQEVYDTVQKLRETKRRIDTLGYANPLTGLLWCADCGAKMYNYRTSQPRSTKEKKLIDVYHCSTYKMGKRTFDDRCSVHHIASDVVKDIILDILKKTIGYIRTHEDEFISQLKTSSAQMQSEAVKKHRKQIAKNEKRANELNKIFNALYEDKVLGKISEERFAEMTATYEQELSDLKNQNARFQSELDEFNIENDKTDKFLALVRKYTRLEKLTNAMLNEFVDKIIVHEGVWSEGKHPNGRPKGIRSQRVDVYLKYIGKFDVPDMRTAEEIEAERIAAEKLEKKRKAGRETARRAAAKKRATNIALAE